MINPNCPECEGIGKIQTGAIVDGQIVNLTVEECKCIIGELRLPQIDCENCDCDHGDGDKENYYSWGVCCSQCCGCVSCESIRYEAGAWNG